MQLRCHICLTETCLQGLICSQNLGVQMLCLITAYVLKLREIKVATIAIHVVDHDSNSCNTIEIAKMTSIVMHPLLYYRGAH